MGKVKEWYVNFSGKQKKCCSGNRAAFESYGKCVTAFFSGRQFCRSCCRKTGCSSRNSWNSGRPALAAGLRRNAGNARFPDVRDPIKFLREREVVHFQRFGDALRVVQDNLDAKNYYAYNPSIDIRPKEK